MEYQFWQGLGIGTVAGAILTEICKQLLGVFVKRAGEKAEGRRKLIRADLEELRSSIEPIVSLTLKYYGHRSQSGADEAYQVRCAVKALAVRWNVVNQRLAEAGDKRLGNSALISFRQALTNELDSYRPNALPLTDPIVESIFRASTKVEEELSRIRYLFV